MQVRLTTTNQQPNFKAVNMKYFNWAQRERLKGTNRYGELLSELRYDVDWGDISVRDGIDTIEFIKTLTGHTDEFTEHVLDCFRKKLK